MLQHSTIETRLMRFILLLLSLCSIPFVFAQSSGKLTDMAFDQVVFYDYNDGFHGEPRRLFDRAGNLSELVTKSVEPEAEDVKALLAALTEKSSFGQAVVYCFDPHFAIVFYEKGCNVQTIEVCLDCNRVEAGYLLPAQKQHPQGEGDRLYYAGSGMSESFQLFINDLLIKYGFSNQL